MPTETQAQYTASLMSAATRPRDYYDREIFAREQRELFARNWIFAGMANEIAQPNDYLRCDIGGRDVIVQNMAGRLRAFVNSCSHRHARIHEELRGNRRLICPYHGWSYDADGVPTGIPKRENFPQVLADPRRFALQQLELECAGHFVFVRLEPGGNDLRGFLGPAYDFLANASGGLDANMDEFSGTLSANWKIVIENALEGYHVPHIHRSTLGSIRQFSDKDSDIIDHLPETGHSYMINQANAEWLGRWKRFERALGSWPFKFDHYVHQLVFPNLTITSFMGYSFHIQRFCPDAVGETSVHSRIYSVRCVGQTEQGAAIMRSVYDEGKAFTRNVFDEDRRACELVFQGVQQAERPAVLASHIEKRIAHFQSTYRRAMRTAAA
jgi:phenylpropionate dioxygenase-like ring-hydroxylating dioxygenase large terminal subunit